MIKIGLIREEKIPLDNRVAFTPSQCKWISKNFPSLKIGVQTSSHRCFSDNEYIAAGIDVTENISDCDILMGIKEVPAEKLIAGKTYCIFSHTKKLQPHNQRMLQKIISNKNTLVDYECLEHEDGKRIIGFGFFAGIVGAHNGIMAFGERTGSFKLDRVISQKDYRHLIHAYFGLKIPPIKIAVTGSGRVAHGVLEIMNLMGIHETEPDLFLDKNFSYPVYVQLKGADLYSHKIDGTYTRLDFHEDPQNYKNLFSNYISTADILMNGVYWEKNIPRLFQLEDLINKNFRLQTIADISDDPDGSVPCNLMASTIADPVYGVDRNDFSITKPYLSNSVDVIAIGNLPNELPRDASRYFGEQIIKYILKDLLTGSEILDRATIVKKGMLTEGYEYMRKYSLTT